MKKLSAITSVLLVTAGLVAAPLASASPFHHHAQVKHGHVVKKGPAGHYRLVKRHHARKAPARYHHAQAYRNAHGLRHHHAHH